MDERRIHRIFQISIIIKGLHATIECAGGIALYFVSTTTIVRWVELLTQDELAEDPRDFVATHFLSAAQHLSVGTETFYAFYLLSHGLVKVSLSRGFSRRSSGPIPLRSRCSVLSSPIRPIGIPSRIRLGSLY